MPHVYSSKTYWSLVAFHIAAPILFLASVIPLSPFFIFLTPHVLGLAVMPLIAISLQDLVSLRFGHIIWLSIAMELWMGWWLVQQLSFVFSPAVSAAADKWFAWIALGFLLIVLFVHAYIASTLFRPKKK